MIDEARPTVAVFRHALLAYSETFIREQGAQLTRYSPLYVGLDRVAGLDLTGERVCVVSRGGPRGYVAKRAFQTLGIGPEFYRRLDEHRPVLVHAHFGSCGLLAARVARRLNVPLTVVFHGYDVLWNDERLAASGFNNRRYVRHRTDLARLAFRLLPVSNFVRQRMLEKGFVPESIAVHYTGLDCERFHPDPSIARDDAVLFVGRLVAYKGCEYLIRAMAALRERHPACELVIIGDGPERAGLERLAAELRVRCRFLGVQPPAEILWWMRRAKVFCGPSVTLPDGEAEAFGMVFLEAQACGTPVVSTWSGGIPEAVADGVSGLLTPERDVRALGEALGHLLSSPDLCRAFGEAGRRRVVEQFDIRRQTARLEEIFDAARAGHGQVATAHPPAVRSNMPSAARPPLAEANGNRREPAPRRRAATTGQVIDESR